MLLWDVTIEVTQIGDNKVDYKFKDSVCGDDEETVSYEAYKSASRQLDEMGVNIKEGIVSFVKILSCRKVKPVVMN